MAGKKPLDILLSQELIRALINVTHSIHHKNLKDESFTAIELVLDHGGVPRLFQNKKKFNFSSCCILYHNSIMILFPLKRSCSDIETLSNWILSQSVPLDASITRIVYKFLNLLKFQSSDAIGMQKLVYICFETLIHLYNSNVDPSPESSDYFHQAVLHMRILSNIVALENRFADCIIENWFVNQPRSMASFFNHFIDLFSACSISIDEIYWFIGNLMKCQLNEISLKYIEMERYTETLVI